MVLAVLGQKSDNFLYQLVYLLHIVTIVAAFAGAMVAPRLGAVAKGGDAAGGRSISTVLSDLTAKMHVPALALAGLFGIVLILLSDGAYDFAQAWISIAFLLWFAMLGVMWFLLRPAQASLAAGGTAEGAKKSAMFTGIIHLLFLLMLIDMVWKPGV